MLDVFKRKVIKKADNECWPWIGSIHRFGYGEIKIQGEVFVASRIAYLVHNNKDPGELDVLHKCDNRDCCNPNHFFLGTNLDNNIDRSNKGRTKGPIKFDYKIVKQIRFEAAMGIPLKEIAKKNNVDPSTISKIVNNERRKLF